MPNDTNQERWQRFQKAEFDRLVVDLNTERRSDFMRKSSEERLRFVTDLERHLDEMKRSNPDLIKKYAVMKLLVTAEQSAMDKSAANLTHGMRAAIGSEVAIGVETGESVVIGHLEEFGHDSWKHRVCRVSASEDLTTAEVSAFTVATKADHVYLFDERQRRQTINSSRFEVTDPTDGTQLRRALAMIDVESRYDHSLGYDLAQGAAYLASAASKYTMGLSLLLVLPVIPVSLVLSAVEVLIIEPFRNLISKGANEAIVDTITSPVAEPVSELNPIAEQLRDMRAAVAKGRGTGPDDPPVPPPAISW